MSRELSERQKWFLERIGKRVYRNDDGCDCDLCKQVLQHGVIITDRHQAQYLYDCECDFTADNTPMRYFDTPEEVNEWLKTLQK